MLVINDLHADDADEYTCRATNAKGTKATQAQLSVLSKPRVFVPPRYHGGYEAKKDENIELKIPFKAYPQPAAKWFKNGEPIGNSDKYQITTDDKYHPSSFFSNIKVQNF